MFRLGLANYCSDCPNFDVKVDKLAYESGNYDENDHIHYIICCTHQIQCDNIYKDLKRRCGKDVKNE